jgi:hypothetical protein
MIISCVRTLSSLSSVGAREGVVARSRGGHGRAWDAWDEWTLSENWVPVCAHERRTCLRHTTVKTS